MASDVNDTLSQIETDDGLEDINQDILADNQKGSFTELNEKINSGNAKINLDKDYDYDDQLDSNLSECISISNEIELDGKGHTLDFKYKYSFKVNSDNVVLKNMNIHNCNRFNHAIDWNGDNGTLIDCNFINENDSNYARAVTWYGSNGLMKGCNFVNCSEKSFGSAVLWQGSNGKIDNSNFVNNNASVKGVVCWKGVNGSLVNSRFINNGDYQYALDQANVVLNYVWDCTSVNIYANPLIRSMYFYYGGAVYWQGDNGVVDSCDFVNNAAYDGGAIYWIGANASISNCNFFNNSAVNYGGAIYCGNNFENSSITNVLLVNNHANNTDDIYTQNKSLDSFLNDSDNILTVKNEILTSKQNEILSNILKYADSYKTKFSHTIENNNIEDNKITVKFLGKDIKTYYNSNKLIKISLKYKNSGKSVVNKVVVVILTSSKGKLYKFNTRTDNTGFIQFKLNKVPVGKYSVSVKINSVDYKNLAKISISKAKSKIIAKKIVGSTKSAVLKVILKDKNGRYIKEGTVKFKINGKVYKVKVKGYASKKIKLPKAKTYRYKATFTSKNYNSCTKYSKLIVKKAKK